MSDSLQTLIAGRWRDASGPAYTTEYPHDGSTVATLHAATAADVDEAVQTAERARMQPGWANLKHHERAGMLYRIANGIRERGEELAQLQRLDNGKPIKECRALVASAAGTFQFFGAAAETWEDTITPSRGDFLSMSTHEPLGVVGAITPWNSPIASEAQKLAPALAAGCAMVFKPAEITPRMAIELARIAQQAGVPDGIISVLPGKGSIVGDALVKHPLIKRIAFTGGTHVGMGIQRLAAEKLMPTSLELGGKNAAVVFADCDFENAINTVTRSVFENAGQVCLGTERVYVERPIFDKFVAALKVKAETMKPGRPFDHDTKIGPLVSKIHQKKVLSYYARAKEEGANIIFGGGVPDMPDDLKDGCWVEPTIWTGLPETASVVREEIFGPCCHIQPFDTEEEAVRMANDTKYGLATSIYTQDISRASRLATQIEVGLCWINSWFLRDLRTPFGGSKQSGIGREGGVHSLEFYTELRNVMIKY